MAAVGTGLAKAPMQAKATLLPRCQRPFRALATAPAATSLPRHWPQHTAQTRRSLRQQGSGRPRWAGAAAAAADGDASGAGGSGEAEEDFLDPADEEEGSDGMSAEELEEQLQAAAALVVDRFIRDGQTVGLGTGAAVNYVLAELAARISGGQLRAVRCIPASDATASEAAFRGVPLTSQEERPLVSVYVEAADQLDLQQMAFLIGTHGKPQQPQLHRARALAAAAAKVVVLAAEPGSIVGRLGGTLAVAVEEDEWEEIGEELDDIFLGDAELWRRSNHPDAGPRGGDHPYVSPEGHALFDIRFYEGMKLFGEDRPYEEVVREVESVAGVVAHGLLLGGAAAAAVVVGPDGVQLVEREQEGAESEDHDA